MGRPGACARPYDYTQMIEARLGCSRSRAQLAPLFVELQFGSERASRRCARASLSGLLELAAQHCQQQAAPGFGDRAVLPTVNGAELPECARAVSAVLVCFIHTALYSSGSTWPTSPHSSHDGTLPIRAPSRQGHLRLVVELVRRDLLDAEELVQLARRQRRERGGVLREGRSGSVNARNESRGPE